MRLPAGGFFFIREAETVVLSCCFGVFLLAQRREALRCSVPNLNSGPRPSCKSTCPAKSRSSHKSAACSRSRHCSLVALHLSQPWFHGGVSRKEAQRLIEKQGLVDGSVFCRETVKRPSVSMAMTPCLCCSMFLIRESQQHGQCFVLSLCHELKIKHYLVIPVSLPSVC